MQLLGREVGIGQPFFLIAGPCVIESEELQLRTAERLKEITSKLGIHFIFKSSFDKANRSSDKSFRGPGMEEGLRVLEKVKTALDVRSEEHTSELQSRRDLVCRLLLEKKKKKKKKDRRK